ncbi:GIN domain-containing protein [Mucilaginibacter ximonensis]|uniref:GIN domain-containing protein n=1 Tax=Mucilaginibacter ximonensis TaxID=538021 RepID=A0ABW5YFD5_9SPHI
MKTSNKFLVAILVLAIISMVSFDMALRAEYKKGDYKSPHYGDVLIPVEDFDVIEDYTSYKTFTDITSGSKFEIWVDKSAQNDLIFTVKNHILKINFKKSNSDDRNQAYGIHIRCPRLNELTRAISPGDKVIYESGSLTMGIFNQDSVRLENSAPGIINLTPVDVKKIKMIMWDGLLNIGGNGNADTADFDIRNGSRLDIGKIKMRKVNYKLDDSSQVTLSGAVWHQIR